MTEHVPDQKRCQRLDELGMPQEKAIFYHFVPGKEGVIIHGDEIIVHKSNRGTFKQMVAAPLATEILAHLRQLMKNGTEIHIEQHDDFCRLYLLDYPGWDHDFSGKFMDALADLLIWCVEQGHVRFEEKAND